MIRATRTALSLLFVAGLAAAADESQSLQNIVVKKGDTLWSIANHYLNDPARWDEILKYNRLPSSDPTVALPGMVLRVPIRLIKSDLRAARLVYRVNKVLVRRHETADWRDAGDNQELLRGDTLRTLDNSSAHVRFLNADLLSLDANSMAIIKPPRSDSAIVLKEGGVFTGKAKVITASAQITPRTKDTQYYAKISGDLSTSVKVLKGLAAVEAQGQSVDVMAGMETTVENGLAPQLPQKIAELPVLEARAGEFTAVTPQGRLRPAPIAEPVAAASVSDAAKLNDDVGSLRVGVPIKGYHVQAATDHNFTQMVFDKVYDADTEINIDGEGLEPGVYWWRIALIDLLGTERGFSAPRQRTVGAGTARRANANTIWVVINQPIADEVTDQGVYRVMGRVKDESVSVTVNGSSARIDESGNFVLDVTLKMGLNEITVRATDAAGNAKIISQHITRTEPLAPPVVTLPDSQQTR